MSGDVQPRKRKDKKRKKDELSVEEHRGTAAVFGEGDVLMHSQHEHGTGGHWCAKIIFFSLLAVLVTLIGLIILENRGLTELEANAVESRYSGVLDGWIEEAPDDDHHDEHTLELKHHEHTDDDDEHASENDLDNNGDEHDEEIDHDEDDDDDEEGHDEEGEDADDDENDDGDEDESKEIDQEEDEDEDQQANDADQADDDDDDDDDEEDDEGSEEQDIKVEAKHDANDDDDDNDDDDKDDDDDQDENDEDDNNRIDTNEEDDDSNELKDIDDDDDDDDDNEEEIDNRSVENDNADDDDDENSKEDNDEDDDEHEEEHEEEIEEEIEKIEKEVLDQEEPESVEVALPETSVEKQEDTSVELVNPDEEEGADDSEFLVVDDLDEPAVERIAPPPSGKPYDEIEDEVSTEVAPNTLAEEEEYEKQQEQLRQEEEQSSSHKDGGNSVEDDWPGEPSEVFWREQLDKAEQDLRQGAFGACEERTSAPELAGSGRALYLRARALDARAEAQRDNRVLAQAISAYLQLLKMNEGISDKKLVVVALRTIDRIKFRGTYLNAEPVYRLLIRRFPNDVTHRNNLTISFLMANRADLASEVLRETLRLWPNDRVALAHYGFILKTEHNKLEEAVTYFKRALEGDAGAANEPRFYYHLGDALLMLGRKDEADAVHRRGAELGHFLSPLQRSLYNVERLQSQPWWDVAGTPYARLARELEAAWRDILREGEAARALYEREREGLRERGEWSQLDVFVRGREVPGRCERAPVTCAIVRREPAARCRRGQVKFSALSGGTHVRAHVGPTNCRLRLHLALSNTQGAYLRVGHETRQWEVGKVLMFDDSFEHEVWHNGTATRLVLIVDVWHPALSPAERRDLPAI
ncbi:uncharacterized protein Asph isoform X4 [Epargyreus clarus]|uniref:uncharacterized protein Asph isoform X4 n=1 Tax=Epargyreus clarus TaxID=520877 RepID=UPI003C2EB3EA